MLPKKNENVLCCVFYNFIFFSDNTVVFSNEASSSESAVFVYGYRLNVSVDISQQRALILQTVSTPPLV
jgi:hypothetical protein